jgi:hypothetical protein
MLWAVVMAAECAVVSVAECTGCENVGKTTEVSGFYYRVMESGFCGGCVRADDVVPCHWRRLLLPGRRALVCIARRHASIRVRGGVDWACHLLGWATDFLST